MSLTLHDGQLLSNKSCYTTIRYLNRVSFHIIELYMDIIVNAFAIFNVLEFLIAFN